MLDKNAYIRKLPNGKYRVLSRKHKNLGTFDSREKAEKHLKEVEYFKHKDNKRKLRKKAIIELIYKIALNLNFDLKSFRKLNTYKECLSYLKDTTKKIGVGGAARDAWDTGLGYVIKIGPDINAQIQNKHEVKVYKKTHSELLPTIYDYDPNYKWIMAETVTPLHTVDNVDLAICAITNGEICTLIELLNFLRENKLKYKSKWLHDLKSLVEICDLKINDLHKGNWGINNKGILVILDTGK